MYYLKSICCQNSVCTIFILWEQGLSTKPFQASSSWHQLKDLVSIKWKTLFQKWVDFSWTKKYNYRYKWWNVSIDLGMMYQKRMFTQIWIIGPLVNLFLQPMDEKFVFKLWPIQTYRQTTYINDMKPGNL